MHTWQWTNMKILITKPCNKSEWGYCPYSAWWSVTDQLPIALILKTPLKACQVLCDYRTPSGQRGNTQSGRTYCHFAQRQQSTSDHTSTLHWESTSPPASVGKYTVGNVVLPGLVSEKKRPKQICCHLGRHGPKRYVEIDTDIWGQKKAQPLIKHFKLPRSSICYSIS